MKKQKLQNNLYFKATPIVNLTLQLHIKGGIAERTGESCFEVCDTNIEKCSWGDA